MDSIIIDANSEKKVINSAIYSAFVEHLGECIHNGIWAYDQVNVPLVEKNPKLIGVRQDLLEAIKCLKPTVIRAFGGCYSDVYHWKDAIGPRNSRKTVKNLQWARFPYNHVKKIGPKIENQFGTDEFLSLCEEVGAVPYLNVNYSTGTPEEAADWVEYCNGSIDTEFGSLRAEYGSKKPYNVKYWGIANEIWGPQERGREKYPENYAKKYLKFAKAMRERDKDIKLVAVGWWRSKWNRAVLQHIGEDWVDYLSVHYYAPLPFHIGFLFGKKHPHKEKKYYSLMSAHLRLREIINNAWEDIIAVFKSDTHVRIAFDEWGIWYKMRDMIKTNYNLQDGLCAALNLMEFQRLSQKSTMANVSEMINVLGEIQTDPDGLVLTPFYHAHKMIVDHSQKNLITGTEVKCENYKSKKYARIKKSLSTPYIECNATINDEEDKLSLIIVNKHFNQNLNMNLDITGFNPADKGVIIELNSYNPFDYNTEKERNKIHPIEKPLENVAPKMTIELPAHSINIIKLSK